jgi:hypothetical protein
MSKSILTCEKVASNYTFSCENCGKLVSLIKKDLNRKFCSQSCAATYNNTKRGARSDQTKQKIKSSIVAQIPQYCKVSWCKYCRGVIQNKWVTVCDTCKSVSHKKTSKTSKVGSDALYPKRHHATIKYTALVLNKSEHSISHADVDQFKHYMHNMIWTDNLSPAQIANKLGIKHTNFGMYITKCLNLPLRDLKSAVKNTAIQQGTARTDEKDIYYADCEFKFSQEEIARIPGFHLIKEIGIYHPVNNPNGAVRDHILSRAEAYQKGYDPSHIRHPANCQFITNQENIKKNSHSDITYDQLLERISLWEKNVLPVLPTTRHKVDKTPEHIENIRQAIVSRLNKIKSGEIVSSMGKAGGRPATFHKKFDWDLITSDIKSGLTYREIGKLRNISYPQLRKASRLKLINR